MLFDDFNARMFDGFSNEHLQDWLDFVFVIEEVRITFKNLRGLGLTLGVWNENGRWWPVNKVVWLDLVLRNEVVTVTEVLPVVSPRHLLHLNVLVPLFFALTLPLPFLDKTTLAHLFLTLFHKSLLHSLLLN